MNTGSKKIFSKNKLLTTICYRINNKTTYALEGSIFIAGAGVQWLRDKIKLINNAYETEKIAKSKKKYVNIGIRLNPNTDAKTLTHISTGKKENKFGLMNNAFLELVNYVKKSKNISNGR